MTAGVLWLLALALPVYAWTGFFIYCGDVAGVVAGLLVFAAELIGMELCRRE